MEEKLLYTIGDAAQIVNVKPYVLRYWETEFSMLNPEKSPSGQRCYRKRDLQVALTIKRLLHEERYTIAGARKKLEELDKEGLDQLEMFGSAAPKTAPEAAAPPEPSPASAAPARPAQAAPRISDHMEEAPPQAQPNPKLQEFRKIFDETMGILEKHGL